MGALRLGTRGSPLALAQTRAVAALLEAAVPGIRTELVVIRTAGEVHAEQPLDRIGGQGVFTRAIEDALLAGEVDAAVHSLKDLPTLLPDGLVLRAVPPREWWADVLVSPRGGGLADLPEGPRVGTASPRRAALVLAARPDARIRDVRGNVETRLSKLDRDEFDALVLSEAGLRRLGRYEPSRMRRLDPRVFTPAAGQGALAVETRRDDGPTGEVVARIDDAVSHACAAAERALLRGLGGGCRTPVGAWCRAESGALVLAAALCRAGSAPLRAELSGPPDEAESLGARLAAKLRAAAG